MVGVNKYLVADEEPYEPLRVDPQIEADQRERLAVLRARAGQRRPSPGRSTSCAGPPSGTDNVLPPMREALRLRATGGEVAHALRDVWGTYQPQDAFLTRTTPRRRVESYQLMNIVVCVKQVPDTEVERRLVPGRHAGPGRGSTG